MNTPIDFLLIPAQPDDWEALIEINMAAMHASQQKRRGGYDPEERRAWILKNFTVDRKSLIEVGGERVGYMVVHSWDLRLWLEIYIKPDALGKGIEEAVLAKFCAQADAAVQTLQIFPDPGVIIPTELSVRYGFIGSHRIPQTPKRSWDLLEEEEDDAAHALLDKPLAFRPSYSDRVTPAILEPAPSIVLDLSAADDAVQEQMDRYFLGAYQSLSKQGYQKLYLVDWNHTSYVYYPERGNGRWPLSWYPNGDYYFFLEADLAFGTFGHPWQGSLCIFGESLIQALPKEFWVLLPQLRNTRYGENL